MLCPFGVACLLEPDARGHGTHEQLGLGPCSFHVLFGQRCPTCGSTTAFVHLARGQWREAVGANAGGTLLATVCLIAGPWLVASAVRGRWLFRAPTEKAVAVVVGAVVVVMVVDWIVHLTCG
ncbi:MAG: DUF2752 domain-containing protein [Pirellulales bacterium]|nr:DUF2752 domain-containing protein [Pirellulales bacterium]